MPRAEDLAPRQVVPPTDARLPDAPAPLPRELGKPDDDLRIEIRRFVLDPAAPAALAAALPGLTSDLLGADKGFEELATARARITRFLQGELGYYLGFAYVPEQELRDGEVRIAVVEGRLDRVILRWPDRDLPVRREVVQAYLDRLQPGAVLLVRDVERVVFLVNDLRGMRARFEVQPGRRPGTASLVVTPEPEAVWSGRAEADANGSRFLGAYRLGGLVQMNSPFGRGDGITANAMVSTTGGLAFGLVGYNTPLGSDGLKLGGSLSAVKYQLDKVEFPLDLNGTAITATVYGLYPVVRARNLNLFAVGTLEHKQYEDQRARTFRARKTVDTLVLGLTGDFRDAALGGGVNTYDATLTAGQLRFQEGGQANSGDAPRFTKLGFGFTRLQDLQPLAPSLQDTRSGKLLAYLSLRGQWAFDNLDTTEQFRIGGPEGVRAFAAGEGTGDSGVVASLEARLLPPEAWFGRLSSELVGSVFIDAGWVRYRRHPAIPADASDIEPNTASYSGAGIGVAWVRPGGYALRASLSAPISGTPRSDPQQRGARFYLQLSKLFQ
ncbi:MAG: ShlB/FhaC/HecB family hemolysin secretion/activation protein [Pseudomonadota bacterium]